MLGKTLTAIWLLSAGLATGEDEMDRPSEVVVLTNKNFEHDTQLSSGGTTGDWFVKFYAPWCGHCKKLEPDWEEVAYELKEEGRINVAKVQ